MTPQGVADIGYGGGPTQAVSPQIAMQVARAHPTEIAQIMQSYGVDAVTAAIILMQMTGQPMRAMAGGGYPQVGEPVLVGERGPEVFTPNVPGSIVPLPPADPRKEGEQSQLEREFGSWRKGFMGWGPEWGKEEDNPSPLPNRAPLPPPPAPPPMTILAPPKPLAPGYTRIPSDIPYANLFEGMHFSPSAWDAWLASRPESQNVIDMRWNPDYVPGEPTSEPPPREHRKKKQ